jgi:hypothetical protein
MTQATEATQTPGNQNRFPEGVWLFEWCLACALTASWIVFHIRFFLHAGALWRDEVNSVDLCNSPTISDIVNNLQFDSFPLLWHLSLRAWIHSGIGSTDQGIRVLGLLTGLGILATLWNNARRFRYPTPIATLTLLGFTSAVLCYGDSIRGYGLGILLELLSLGFMWDIATKPNAWRVCVALIAALASVQVLFYNSVVLFAICCGAAAVALRQRHFSRVLLIGIIGLVCAISVAPYHVLAARSAGFRPMLLHEPTISWLMSKFTQAVGFDPSNPISTYEYNDRMWELAVIAALVVALLSALQPGEIRAATGAVNDPQPIAGSKRFRMDVATYHLTILLVGVPGYWLFLHALAYVMQPWYYLALLGLVAACVDGLFASTRAPLVRVFLCLAALRYCAVNAAPDWYDARLRKTNIKLICDQLSRLENRGDLVVLSPWFYGVTFQRYHKGPAVYVAVPGVSFLSYQKMDLLIKPMQNPDAMQPMLDQIAAALHNGHSVYLIGDYLYPNYGPSPPTIHPVPDPMHGWDAGQYSFAWAQQVAYLVVHHAKSAEPLDVRTEGVSDYERPDVRVVKGWIDPPTGRRQ